MLLHRQPEFSVIDAPSILGLRTTGVDASPKSLAGQQVYLNNQSLIMLEWLLQGQLYNYRRDDGTGLLNPQAIKDYTLKLAEAVNGELLKNKFPIVIGDCSILIGNILALRRLGRYGLFFIDDIPIIIYQKNPRQVR